MEKNFNLMFLEYGTAKPGQHFMTVIARENYEKIIIGRIYREYDYETKKAKYKAVDFNGDQIFGDGLDLVAIKDKFKKHGKFLADGIIMTRQNAKLNEKQQSSSKVERSDAVKKIRQKSSQTKTKEVVKPIPNEKPNPELKDNVKSDRSKDLENIREHNTSEENVQEKEGPAPDSQVQDKRNLEQNDEVSEREAELDDIREQNEDREQDMELDR